ncbi:MAG: winged helix-turn-helix domain-containing protein [Candidatus Heimdallarchaeota archaeon]
MPPTKKVSKDQATILELINEHKEIGHKEIVEITKIDQVRVAKTILELSEAGFIDCIEKTTQIISLTKEGKGYVKSGLPEKLVFDALKNEKERTLLDDFKKNSGINEQLINIAIGWLRRKNWVEFTKEGKKTFVKTKGY